MRSQVLTPRPSDRLLTGEPAAKGPGIGGWTIVADAFLIVGVTLVACLLGLVIGATLSSVAFVPSAYEMAAVAAHSPSSRETLGGRPVEALARPAR